MQIDYEILNNEVNELAADMVSYSPDDINKTHVKRISNDIAIRLFEVYERGHSGTNQYGDEIRRIRLFIRGKPTERKEVPNSVFIDTLFELLGRKKDGNWVFNSEKSTFTTAFHDRLSKRLLDYYKDKSDYNNKTTTYSYYEEDARSDCNKLCNEWSAFAIILDALGRFSEKLNHFTVKEQKYYEGYFTFDRTENVKNDEELGKVACEHNNTIFPYMVISLLEFLMTGTFSSMYDIISNPLKTGVNLSQRGDLLEEYFNYSHPTQVKYNQKYNELWAAIVNEIQCTT